MTPKSTPIGMAQASPSDGEETLCKAIDVRRVHGRVLFEIFVQADDGIDRVEGVNDVDIRGVIRTFKITLLVLPPVPRLEGDGDIGVEGVELVHELHVVGKIGLFEGERNRGRLIDGDWIVG